MDSVLWTPRVFAMLMNGVLWTPKESIRRTLYNITAVLEAASTKTGDRSTASASSPARRQGWAASEGDHR